MRKHIERMHWLANGTLATKQFSASFLRCRPFLTKRPDLRSRLCKPRSLHTSVSTDFTIWIFLIWQIYLTLKICCTDLGRCQQNVPTCILLSQKSILTLITPRFYIHLMRWHFSTTTNRPVLGKPSFKKKAEFYEKVSQNGDPPPPVLLLWNPYSEMWPYFWYIWVSE